jgi:hypothetical protein
MHVGPTQCVLGLWDSCARVVILSFMKQLISQMPKNVGRLWAKIRASYGLKLA